MAMIGTTIFSHILPVLFGLFGFIFIISGALEDDKGKEILGAVIFIIACVFPYLVLSVIL